MKIVITDAETVTSGDINLNVFSNLGELQIYDMTAKSQIDERIAEADILLCNKTPITAKNIEKAKNLKYIGLFATGFNNIDVDFAKQNRIVICNAPNYSTDAVAQLTFSYILNFYSRVSEYNSLVLNHEWINSKTFSYFPLPTFELSNKTLGIMGFGAIGKRVCRLAKAFNMNVLVCNRSKISEKNVKQVDFETLLEKSDIVSLHCPLNEQSKGIMNEQAFAKMKKGALFINTARGPLVDENALKNALESGKLVGVGLDVLTTEPMSKDCPLFGIKNCIITPHIAWAGLETRERLVKIVYENVEAFLNGKPKNQVF